MTQSYNFIPVTYLTLSEQQINHPVRNRELKAALVFIS